jgi:hypothetical protein
MCILLDRTSASAVLVQVPSVAVPQISFGGDLFFAAQK